MRIEKELVFGLIGSIIIILLAIFYSLKYQYQKKNFQQQTSSQSLIKKNSVAYGQKTVVLTLDQISKHNRPDDCWIIINNSVYQVTGYLSFHPGGAGRIIPFCGQEATTAYMTKGGKGSHSTQAASDLSKLKIGAVNQEINLSKIKDKIKAVNSYNQELEGGYED